MLTVPFMQATIINHLQVILNNKRDNVIFEAFLEKDESTDTPVAILKRMDTLKIMMECNDLFERMIRTGVIVGQQFENLRLDFFRCGGISTTDLVRNVLVLSDSKPIFP